MCSTFHCKGRSRPPTNACLVSSYRKITQEHPAGTPHFCLSHPQHNWHPISSTSSMPSPDCADYLFTKGISKLTNACSKIDHAAKIQQQNKTVLQTYLLYKHISLLASCKTGPFIYNDEHSNVPRAEPHRAGEAVAAAKETDRSWRPRGGVGGRKTLGVIFLLAFVARILPFRSSMHASRASSLASRWLAVAAPIRALVGHHE